MNEAAAVVLDDYKDIEELKPRGDGNEEVTGNESARKRAGVGAGTLYRHFPTRDALIAAVYRSEVEKLAAAERRFAAAMPPIEALRAWMLLLVDYIAAKHIIAPALNSVVGGLQSSTRAPAA